MEFSAYVTRDGKYLFFMSRRLPEEEPEKLTYQYLDDLFTKPETGNSSIYWMEAGIIDSLRAVATFR
ncbi:MAG: hypothetical protein R2727_11365 [Bacteroidales bacterium]